MTSTLPSAFGSEMGHELRCSRAGCAEEADWAILWRNPRIHAPNRTKTWLACQEHRSFLYDFLHARGFPLEVRPVAELGAHGTASGMTRVQDS